MGEEAKCSFFKATNNREYRHHRLYSRFLYYKLAGVINPSGSQQDIKNLCSIFSFLKVGKELKSFFYIFVKNLYLMMSNGKKICNLLKSIRKEIAQVNHIEYEMDDCPFQGDCKGTCPKCEAEVRYIETQLSLRQKAGKVIKIAGVATSFLALSACQSSGSEAPQKLVQCEDRIDEGLKADELVEEIPMPAPPEPPAPPEFLESITMGFVSYSNDSDSVVVQEKPIVVSEKEQKIVIQFLSELYGLNEYQGFMFSDLDFLLPHCTERLLQKLQEEFVEEEGYAVNVFRTPAQDGNSINVLESVEHKYGNTYRVKYFDRGHEATTEIEAYVIAGKVLLNDVRLIEWGEEVTIK